MLKNHQVRGIELSLTEFWICVTTYPSKKSTVTTYTIFIHTVRKIPVILLFLRKRITLNTSTPSFDYLHMQAMSLYTYTKLWKLSINSYTYTSWNILIKIKTCLFSWPAMHHTSHKHVIHLTWLLYKPTEMWQEWGVWWTALITTILFIKTTLLR